MPNAKKTGHGQRLNQDLCAVRNRTYLGDEVASMKREHSYRNRMEPVCTHLQGKGCVCCCALSCLPTTRDINFELTTILPPPT